MSNIFHPPQVDYRHSPSFVGDVPQSADSYANPNAAPAVPVDTGPEPDVQYYDLPQPMVPGFSPDAQIPMDLSISTDPARQNWALTNPDVNPAGYAR